MDIDSLTIKEAREAIERGRNLEALLGGNPGAIKSHDPLPGSMLGKYVIVRCHAAGVHAGVLDQYSGERGCILNESRRLWYWKPANGQAFLSGVAAVGLDSSSKIGAPVRIHLTENCEIIECSDAAKASISGMKSYEPK